jgi:hypothetical protein
VASTAQREHLVALLRWTIAHERAFHYLQRRPMHYVSWSETQLRAWLIHGGTVSMDCSEYVKTMFHMSGLHDPTGRGFDAFGNTDSMLSTLPHYDDASEAHPGALVVWGRVPSHHVAVVLERGDNPTLASHGREAGPVAVRLHAEDVAQRFRPRTFLSIAAL